MAGVYCTPWDDSNSFFKRCQKIYNFPEKFYVRFNYFISDELINWPEDRIKKTLFHELLHVSTERDDDSREFLEELERSGLHGNPAPVARLNWTVILGDANKMLFGENAINSNNLIEFFDETWEATGTDFNYWATLLNFNEKAFVIGRAFKQGFTCGKKRGFDKGKRLGYNKGKWAGQDDLMDEMEDMGFNLFEFYCELEEINSKRMD